MRIGVIEWVFCFYTFMAIAVAPEASSEMRVGPGCHV